MVNKLLVCITMVMVMVGVGYAEPSVPDVTYDPINYNCAEGWGENVTCLGNVPLSEFQNPDSHLKRALNGDNPLPYPAIWSPYDSNDMGITPVGASLENFRYDNKRKPDTMPIPQANRIVIKAKKAGFQIPEVQAILVYQPGDDCTPDNDWHFNQPDERGCPDGQLPQDLINYPNVPENFPVVIYHINWLMTPECEQVCNEQDWNWQHGDGTPCSECHEHVDGSPVPNGFAGTRMRVSADYYKATEVVNAVRLGSSDQYFAHWEENATFNYMKYDPNANKLYTQGIWDDFNSIYFGDVAGILPSGNYTWQINFNDGQTLEFNGDVVSDTVMPVVAAENTLYQDTVYNKSGKAIKGLSNQNIAVPNLTAKVLGGKLVIQWAEPDAAMTLPDSTRLRIFVGDGWFNAPKDGSIMDYDFLWMDVPLHTGTVVVPVEQWNWVKHKMRDKGRNHVDIGGMYREQFHWERDGIGIDHHNRGYFEGISYTFE